MKRVLIILASVCAAPFILFAIIFATISVKTIWQTVRVAPDSPERSLQQLAQAARVGLWVVVDEYADRKAMREDLERAAYTDQAGRSPCPNCEGGTLLPTFEIWREQNAVIMDGFGPEFDDFIKGLCEAVDSTEGGGATVTRSADDQWAEVSYPTVKGFHLRLKMHRVSASRWRVVSIPSAAENFAGTAHR